MESVLFEKTVPVNSEKNKAAISNGGICGKKTGFFCNTILLLRAHSFLDEFFSLKEGRYI